jgi:hypothetical protein
MRQVVVQVDDDFDKRLLLHNHPNQNQFSDRYIKEKINFLRNPIPPITYLVQVNEKGVKVTGSSVSELSKYSVNKDSIKIDSTGKIETEGSRLQPEITNCQNTKAYEEIVSQKKDAVPEAIQKVIIRCKIIFIRKEYKFP